MKLVTIAASREGEREGRERGGRARRKRRERGREEWRKGLLVNHTAPHEYKPEIGLRFINLESWFLRGKLRASKP